MPGSEGSECSRRRRPLLPFVGMASIACPVGIGKLAPAGRAEAIL